jgi:hypothetical protein
MVVTGCAHTYLEENVSKPAQEYDGPHKLEPVILEGLAHPDTVARKKARY